MEDHCSTALTAICISLVSLSDRKLVLWHCVLRLSFSSRGAYKARLSPFEQ